MSSVIFVPSTVTTVNVVDDATATVSTTTATDTQVVVSNLQGPQGATGTTGAGGALGYYGAFSDTTTQTVAAINTAYTMTLNTTDEASGVSRGSPTSRIVFAYAGTYNFQWSGQFQNTNNKDEDINVWIRINGTNVVGSNGLINVPAKHAGADGHIIAGWNYIETFAASDYIELVWSSSATAVTLQAYSATSPAPSTASLIVTAQQVMYTQVGPTGATGASGVAVYESDQAVISMRTFS